MIVSLFVFRRGKGKFELIMQYAANLIVSIFFALPIGYVNDSNYSVCRT